MAGVPGGRAGASRLDDECFLWMAVAAIVCTGVVAGWLIWKVI